MQNSKSSHPWRKGRTSTFTAFLETLPAEERHKIEAAERAFVLKRERPTSLRAATERDFARIMVGEEEALDTPPAPC